MKAHQHGYRAEENNAHLLGSVARHIMWGWDNTVRNVNEQSGSRSLSLAHMTCNLIVAQLFRHTILKPHPLHTILLQSPAYLVSGFKTRLSQCRQTDYNRITIQQNLVWYIHLTYTCDRHLCRRWYFEALFTSILPEPTQHGDIIATKDGILASLKTPAAFPLHNRTQEGPLQLRCLLLSYYCTSSSWRVLERPSTRIRTP